ncbi:MAG TPA: hypothetical protein VH164_15475, partial [Ktedonobacteraceae bacterium]|nr:hypothetical protein [Ktedonobacteraceae bacterium]
MPRALLVPYRVRWVPKVRWVRRVQQVQQAPYQGQQGQQERRVRKVLRVELFWDDEMLEDRVLTRRQLQLKEELLKRRTEDPLQ